METATTSETTTAEVWLSVAEAERHTGLSYSTLWRAVVAGSLKASGRGKGRKFRRGELDRWMESRD